MTDDATRPRAAVGRPTVDDVAEEALDERFGGAFVDGDGSYVVKVVRPTDADQAAVLDAMRAAGIEGTLTTREAKRSLSELRRLTEEVGAYLRSAGTDFACTYGPDVHREVVELTMGADEDEQRMAAELQVAFRGRGLVVTMRPGFFARFV
jgi:hypothetical protein